MFTDHEVIAMLRNVGVDVECGACMEVAFTGVTTNTHTCKGGSGNGEIRVVQNDEFMDTYQVVNITDLILALRQIAAKDDSCQCDHSDGNCCAQVGIWCAHCLAEVAIAKATGECR